ncbi:MAG: YjgN family protein [Inhella sp.]|uniref:YjgN family protein n=3 Tax=Inhella sp. TaxID=1921806 RepID=UPI0022BDAA16|nr:YjgN family protein [Inhella sp.]MCZ8235014.1 YjgN family protein [Inhella sp.]
MSDTPLPTADAGSLPPADHGPTLAVPVAHEPVSRLLPLQFTASGSEYFRIWIVNLLLIVLTLGFYMPFAKARRLRYFYANTVIDGHPLAFHGDPWKMLRGYVLMLLLFGGYSLSGHLSSWLSVAVFGLLALLWPALWRSSLRFRLSNTSWRGLRFAFEGDLKGAYRAMLPLAVPTLLILVANAIALQGVDPEDTKAMSDAMLKVAAWNGGAMLVLMAMLPWSLTQIKRYQHNGYRYAGQVARMLLNPGPVYAIGGIAFAILLGGLVAIVVLVMLAAVIGGALGSFVPGGKAGAMVVGGVVMALVFLGYLALLFTVQGYFSARLQNLTWDCTRSQQLCFESDLSALALTRRLLLNLVLTVFTLGLYRPFAVVAVHRLRLEAMRIELIGRMDDWGVRAAAAGPGAAGEMSGDFFGIDVGL